MDRGFAVYKDLSSNHQPLPYLFSYATQKISQPENIYMLINRHRQAMLLYSLAWIALLILRWRKKAILFLLAYESVKLSYLGNLVLAESLSAYPFAFLTFAVYSLIALKEKLSKIDYILVGLCLFLVGFNLVPLWPLLLIYLAIFYLKDKPNIWLPVTIALVATVMLFTVISPLDWFRETILYNSQYAIPRLNEVHGIGGWGRIIFFPFYTLVFVFSPTAQTFIGFFLILASVAWLSYRSKNRRFLNLLGMTYLFLLLANNRVLSPVATHYSGFHLIPWVILVFISTIYIAQAYLRANHPCAARLKLALVAFIIFLVFRPGSYLYTKTDVAHEYYVNYSIFEDLNYAVSKMAVSGDRMAVLTSTALVHWNTPTIPATRQIVYYPWENDVPELKQTFEEIFHNDPPEFVYGDIPVYSRGFYREITKSASQIDFFILETKLEELSQESVEAIGLREFEIMPKPATKSAQLE
jgi:hypothetical protein